MKIKILENVSKGGYIKKTFLKNNDLTTEECYKIVFGIGNCKYCGNTAVFSNWVKGYNETCISNECKKKLRKERTEKTNLEKYGVKNISQLPEIKDRKLESSIKTNLDRYGVKNVFQSKEIMFKDGIHSSQTNEVNAKRNKTLLEKYNTTDLFTINNGRERGLQKCNSDEVNEARKKTNLEKYGVEYAFQSQDFQEYIRTCNINKYGVENNMFRGDVKEKHAESCIIRDIKRKEDIDENGLNSFHRAMVKSKETNIKNGYWIPNENKTDFEIYYAEVWKYTRRNDLSNLEHIEKRGHANQGKFHLDHKYSIFQGFKDRVSPAIIGSIYNLEMITGRNNLSKGRKCSIGINTLLGNIMVKNEVFSVKVSIDKKYQKIIDFYTKDGSLSRLINILLDECEKDKPFKFKILKKMKKLDE